MKRKLAETEASNSLKAKQAKEEFKKLAKERDELEKSINKLLGKETQYQHEIKNKERVAEKLQERLTAKVFRDQKQSQGQSLPEGGSFFFATVPNQEMMLHGGNPDAEFSRMMASGLEQRCQILTDENDLLKSCLKEVRRELVESVNHELSLQEKDRESTGKLEHIREELFALPLDDDSNEGSSHRNATGLSRSFQRFFARLREVRAEAESRFRESLESAKLKEIALLERQNSERESAKVAAQNNPSQAVGAPEAKIWQQIASK